MKQENFTKFIFGLQFHTIKRPKWDAELKKFDESALVETDDGSVEFMMLSNSSTNTSANTEINGVKTDAYGFSTDSIVGIFYRIEGRSPDRFRGYVRIGIATVNRTIANTTVTPAKTLLGFVITPAKSTTTTTKESSTVLGVGIGGNYYFTDNWYVGFGLNVFPISGSNVIGEGDIGIGYKF